MAQLTAEQKKTILSQCKTPYVCLPTLFLFSVASIIWALAIYLFIEHSIGLPLLFVLSFLAQFFFYTCLHEAVHNAVSSSSFINNMIGRIASVSLFGIFWGFRYVHLKHHRFTNNHEKDPDFWSASPFLFFRWLTQDLYYYWVYIKDRRALPWSQRIEVVLQLTLSILLFVFLFRNGYAKIALFAWILPARAVIFWLAFIFNFLPHYPHDPKTQDNPYKETCVRTPNILIPIFLYQNYHNIHHLYPAAPFYRYKTIWETGREYFIAQGTVVKNKIWEL